MLSTNFSLHFCQDTISIYSVKIICKFGDKCEKIKFWVNSSQLHFENRSSFTLFRQNGQILMKLHKNYIKMLRKLFFNVLQQNSITFKTLSCQTLRLKRNRQIFLFRVKSCTHLSNESSLPLAFKNLFEI